MDTGAPWRARYRRGTGIDEPPATPIAALLRRGGGDPTRPAIRYFGRTVTAGDLDRSATALASALRARGLRPGDRVALCLQNVPAFPVAALAAWRAGCIVVPVNPMLKERELELVLTDSGARALVTHPSLYEIAEAVLPRTAVELVVTSSETEGLGDDVPPLLAGIAHRTPPGTVAMQELFAAHENDRLPPQPTTIADVAFLTYTSGTTGPPKGAMNTHGNVAYTTEVYRRWMDLGEHDVILGVAPLFHITGLIGHLTLSMAIGAPLVLGYRFHAPTMLDLVERERPTFTVGAITAFIALMNEAGARGHVLSSLRTVYSGGAPISPATADAYERLTGVYVHNIYGLTETTSPSHAVPLGARAPVDPASGALSVGVPVPGTHVEIVDDDGTPLPPGHIGEIVTSGPGVVAGYWNKPEETARALPGGRLHTGDVGTMDEEGWFYLVDRKKDMIIASGYKVWPREVEDVLYGHPAVREAAVVGVPDAYRGETVKAVVSLRDGTDATPEELIAFCRERMAAYKYPRIVEIIAELPKTTTGKILRRALRG